LETQITQISATLENSSIRDLNNSEGHGFIQLDGLMMQLGMMLLILLH